MISRIELYKTLFPKSDFENRTLQNSISRKRFRESNFTKHFPNFGRMNSRGRKDSVRSVSEWRVWMTRCDTFEGRRNIIGRKASMKRWRFFSSGMGGDQAMEWRTEVLSSLGGLEDSLDQRPSHEWLGYFRRGGVERGAAVRGILRQSRA